MSMYDNDYKDSLYEGIVEFLSDHPVSELLEMVASAVSESRWENRE